MRKFFTTVTTLLVCGMIYAPVCDAQSRGRGRQNGQGGGSRTEQQSRPQNNRPNNGNRHENNGGRHDNNNNRPGRGDRPNNGRPGNNGGRPENNNRPNNGYRPGHNNGRPDNGYRPGHNNGRPDNGYRPGHNNGRPDNGYRPGHNNGRPEHGYRPGGGPHYDYRPHHRPPYHAQPPYRPYWPAHRPWSRPVPPPHFRPYHGGPRFSTILGVTLGSALNISLNMLINGGYNVSGYGPSTIYLTGVPMFNYNWPNATFNYEDGVFSGSEFVYSTRWYDRARYDNIYNRLIREYGYPVSVRNDNGNSIAVTWWGYNNGYISLSYYPDYAYDGSLRYYTTLSIGR